MKKKIQNKLFYGDNLEVLRKYIKDETIDLCYIDPPFNSKRNYNQIYNNIGKEDKAQAQAFVDTWTWDTTADNGFAEISSNYNGAFTKQSIDLITGLAKVLGKGSLLAYLVSMTLRIAEIQRVLKPNGTFYLHCDPTASHYLKIIIDAIFCVKGGDFKNEIIWCYTAPTNTRDNFPRKHDVIFRYTKSNDWIFDFEAVSIPYSEETIARTGRGSGNQGLYKSTNPEAKHANRLKPKGKIPEDWWVIPRLQGNSLERLGYPTQKPEALLERIIKASTKEGDMILDAYCGCGTSVAVAERLNRSWIGIDITYQSISLIIKRLEENFGLNTIKNVNLNGVPEDMESAVALANKTDDRTRKEFEKWAVLTYSNNRAMINEKKGGDGGIDGFAFMLDLNENNEQENKDILFSVKSNKTLTPAVVRDLYGTVERDGAAIGILLTLYKMENLSKEAKKYGTYFNKLIGATIPKIEVISVEEMLGGKTMKLPTSLEVLKKAEVKINDVNQHKLDF